MMLMLCESSIPTHPANDATATVNTYMHRLSSNTLINTSGETLDETSHLYNKP